MSDCDRLSLYARFTRQTMDQQTSEFYHISHLLHLRIAQPKALRVGQLRNKEMMTTVTTVSSSETMMTMKTAISNREMMTRDNCNHCQDNGDNEENV